MLFPKSTMLQPMLSAQVVFVDAIKDSEDALVSGDASLIFTHPGASVQQIELYMIYIALHVTPNL